jgi:hypothetical protein
MPDQSHRKRLIEEEHNEKLAQELAEAEMGLSPLSGKSPNSLSQRGFDLAPGSPSMLKERLSYKEVPALSQMKK